MRATMTIGRFAAVTHLSVRMLRRYHDNGLLVPAEVDPATGYRSYVPEQVATAQTIRRLRELDMPVPEIRDLVRDTGGTGGARREELLTAHLQRLEERLEQTRDAVAALRRLLGDDDLEVSTREVDEVVVAAVSGDLSLPDLQRWYGEATSELGAALSASGLLATGPAGALYEDALFAEEHGGLTVHLPVAGPPPTTGRVHPFTIPAARLAVAVHRGSHHDLDVTYGRLATWVLGRGVGRPGPVRETYLVGPGDTPEASRWVTEIAVPIH